MSEQETQALGQTKAFEPIKVGTKELSTRLVLAPLTRYRAVNDHDPSDLSLEYYTQRAQYKGSLLTTEATFISEEAGGYPNVPGLWSDTQTKAWKKIVDSVHSKGALFNAQLWNLGRQADPEYLSTQKLPYISASDIYMDDASKEKALKFNNKQRGLTKAEIKQHVEQYVKAAKNAINGAGFDFVEVHAANGYLIDQFLQPISNNRKDEYGGSVENRSRFLLEVVDAVCEAVGSSKVSVRLSPWGTFGSMGGQDDPNIIPTYSYVVSELEKRRRKGNELAYISLVEPRVSGDNDTDNHVNANNDWILLIWKGIVLRTGGFASTTPDYKRLFDTITINDRTLIGIGRYFLSNPDFITKVHDGLPLNAYNRDTFYTRGSLGYTTYPNYGEDAISDDDPRAQRDSNTIV
ncbi:NADPH dehydrogenase 3 [Wickerhamomyces ciferrii]|uniref:NADPH dehydrogenase 3 n=1 Tax=Wickerhamomyces ciferrii (strain ATCC 14091 / BCRC 22168 / CBS 111 / JCM 3599 / NBRC 0793 / NRRL Y-1031 F-60-10) TaxID=1206466 RepID=K0KIR0_WICCF|nr:NADPH dehydrogenase 3 [Wickerhamomyces ciferrii]CCH45100.1 NADPH dehydrogenase 3 [Wickerhamomyces ciferrii]